MKLYALCDQDMLDSRGISLHQYILIARKYNATILQYRNKNGMLSFIKEQLLEIKRLFPEVQLIVNDYYKLAEYCDGVHLGQEDLSCIKSTPQDSISYIRDFFVKDKLLGLSTHNIQEIEIANKLDLDYIGLGAYRATTTKQDIQNILGEKLDLLAKKSKHKVAAIGGVRMDDIFYNVEYHVIGSGLL